MGTRSDTESAGASLAHRALELARKVIIVDAHMDVPFRLYLGRDETGTLSENVAEATVAGDFDHPRARAGGLSAPILAIYVPASYQDSGGAKDLADSLIDLVESVVVAAPQKFALASNPEQVEQNFTRDLISFAMGIENGAAVENDVGNVLHFARRGISYITLTHSRDNQLCDASSTTTETWKGLSPLGRQVVQKMVALGMMVDTSHVSDRTFFQILDMTSVPVIASHSSCRRFTPGFARNISDDMLRQLQQNNGVVGINFGSKFLSPDWAPSSSLRQQVIAEFIQRTKCPWNSPETRDFVDRYDRDHPRPYADAALVAEHVDHVVQLIGIDHVGIGADYDGVGDSLPTGLKDVSTYPTLIELLLERGYSDADVEKVCSGNFMRVWRACRAAATLRE